MEACSSISKIAIFLRRLISYDGLLHSYLHCAGSPSCLHTTRASDAPQSSSQTAPHSPPRQISTLPSFAAAPSSSLTSPSVEQRSAVAIKMKEMKVFVVHYLILRSIPNAASRRWIRKMKKRAICLHYY